MKTVFKAISRENLNDIPEPCRFCLYWESPEDFEELLQKKRPQLAAKKKREWFVQTLRDFGDCGKIVYQNDMPVGYAQYAPVSRLSQATNYKSNPPGRIAEGTVFLSCLFINDEKQRGKGIGGSLLGEIITELRDRGFKAIETFARRGSANNPSGPIEFYLGKDFQTKDETDPDFPLVRREL